MSMGSIRINCPGNAAISGNRVQFDHLAIHNGFIKAVSIVGETQYLKAYRAILSGGAGSDDTTLECTWPSKEDEEESGYFYRDKSYTSKSDRAFRFGEAYMVFISTDPTFMKSMSDEELYIRLYPDSQMYDVPLADEWLPYIKQELLTRKLLVPCQCFNLESAVLTAGNGELEEIVKDGLRTRKITMPGGVRLVG